jgi:hypothetical protein
MRLAGGAPFVPLPIAAEDRASTDTVHPLLQPAAAPQTARLVNCCDTITCITLHVDI